MQGLLQNINKGFFFFFFKVNRNMKWRLNFDWKMVMGYNNCKLYLYWPK